ncbi:MAG: hypothetical protein K2W94_01300 [Alphaproteobacteria bacterium]|nr:hypothetical protein [Alphaproteobacteria bacterium]
MKATLNKPAAWLIQKHKLNFFCSFMFVAVISSVTYVGFAFVNVFLKSILKLPTDIALSYACFGTFLAMISVLSFGFIAEKIGTEKTVLVSTGLLIFFAIPIHFLLGTGYTLCIILALILLAIPTGGVCGPAPYFI